MKSENGMVNGTDGTDRTARNVGTSRCPACGIRGRPSGPSLPGCRFGCRRSLPWSAAILCRFAGARTALSAPFRLAHCSGTDAQQVLAVCQCPTERGILTGCFTSFQLVSPGFSYQEKRIGTGRLKTCVFSYEERTCSRSLQTANVPTTHVSLTRALCGIFTRLVAGCCTWLQLVAACCSYGEKFEEASMKREISNCQREIQDTETGRWAGYVGL